MYSFPPGFRFVPTNEELIRHYLMKRIIMNHPLPNSIIFRDLDIYDYSPKQLHDMFQHREEREMYFFTTRNRRCPNGSRPNRYAGNGFWKATGGDRPVPKVGPTIGCKKALVYYEGKPPQRPTKTTWIMHEYRLSEKYNSNHVINPSTSVTTASGAPDGDMKLDGLVLCKIYNTEKEEPKNISSKSTSNTPDGGGGHTGHNSYPTLQLDHQFLQPVDNQLPPFINCPHDPLQMTDINNAPLPSGFVDHHPQAADLPLFMFDLSDDRFNIIGGLEKKVACGMSSDNMLTDVHEYCPELPDDDFSFVEEFGLSELSDDFFEGIEMFTNPKHMQL